MKSAAKSTGFYWARRQWNALTLARQFVLAGTAVLLAGMFAIGFWVTRQIEDGVVRNSAAATALYVDSVIAPLFPDLEGKRVLSDGARRALDETLAKGEMARRIAFFKIWVDDGLIAYSSEPTLIGKTFEPTESLRQAWAGHVTAEFDSLEDPENRTEQVAGMRLLEIYSPIREPWSGEVIAVAEFYEVASELADNLAAARLRSWLVVALVTLGMLGLLSGIVLRGSVIISQQRAALEQRVGASELLRQNEHLRQKVQAASGRAAMVNERLLRRTGADLHDGPAQLLALALLRMNESSDEGRPDQEMVNMSTREYLEEAMREIRSICRGLILPQIEPMNLEQLLTAATSAHERRTGTHVGLWLPSSSPELSQSEKVCIYRFVQEGLTNSFRHAGGAGQKVTADMQCNKLIISVADAGAGFDIEAGTEGGIGLAGLRERVESLGGEFTIKSSSSGTSLIMGLRPSLGEAG